jgi:hypothetical protein
MSIDKKALIAQISQNVKVPPPPPETISSADVQIPNEGQKSADRGKRSGSLRKKSKPAPAVLPGTSSGRQAAFWLDDEDRGIFREVGMLLYTQGIKPSDNLVFRAALRLMPRDHRLMEQIQVLLEKDGRRLRHRDKHTS